MPDSPTPRPAQEGGTCETCRFSIVLTYASWCRRLPPYSDGWPKVKPQDWCGEYQPKGPLP